MAQEKVRVRFAPSPTGFLHIGGARTALFNWLYARHTGGEFILRIEDTDRARSEDRFRDEILESLKWLGLDWDGELVYQSQRFELYREYAQKLVDQGRAFHEDKAVKFKIPPENVRIKDIVYGDVHFDNSLMDTLVIIKSDGAPTYNFSCVIDDALMGVNLVIRGDDHISNTPKQIALYQALGLAEPSFAHVPMILGSDGTRLSKRHGATSVLQYRELGFVPEALVNFLALLGWSPGNNIELMDQKELFERFSLERINRKSAIFDLDKLEWMNGQYLQKMALSRLMEEVRPFSQAVFPDKTGDAKLQQIIELFRGRFRTLAQFSKESHYFFEDKIVLNSAAVEKYLSNSEAKKRISLLKGKLEDLPIFDAVSTEKATRELAAELGLKAGDLIHPTRVAITGEAVSPGLFQIMELMGRDCVVKRISAAAGGDS